MYRQSSVAVCGFNFVHSTDDYSPLYMANQAANNRDIFSDNKYITPVVVHGKVYVGTSNSVAVFGLLP